MKSLTDYLLESKADWPDPATPTDPAEGQGAEETPTEWAGDLYDQGDESDPAQAFAVFTGGAGLEGWLDRADDGTLTGWVRDPDGSVYRYSDVDAWAIDVRDAGMNRTDPGLAGEEPADGEGEEDPNADPAEEAPADGEDPLAEGDDTPPELQGEDDAASEAPDELAPEADDAAATDGTDDGTNPDEQPDDADGADENDEDEDWQEKVKRKGMEGKSYELVYTPWGA